MWALGTGGMGVLGRARAHVGLVWMNCLHPVEEERQGLVENDHLSWRYGEEREELEDDSCQGEEPNQHASYGHTQPSITTWEAGWNITNAIQGVFVLALPHALLHSGVLGLFLLFSSACVCSYTGKILVSCLYEEDEWGHVRRVRHTYEDIADACCPARCPSLGGRLVRAAQVVELTMTCVLYLVVSGNLMSHGLPFLPLSPAVCSALTFLTLVPCMLIRDLRVVSRLSFLCSFAQFLITFIVIGYCLRQSPHWTYGTLRLAVDLDGFLEAVGVIIFSYTSQILLPTLEGCMVQRKDFSTMMDSTHMLAGVLKTTFSLLALLTWGDNTKEVVSDNLPTALRIMVNLCLLAKALLSYPLPFYAATHLLHAGIGQGVPGRTGGGAEWGMLLLRGSLLCLTFIMALCVPRFSLLMGMTGSVTGATMTLLLPALFHLHLKWAWLGWGRRMLDVFILALGVFCTGAWLICIIRAVVETFGSR